MEQGNQNQPNTQCKHCGNKWMYSGSAKLASCPSCTYKTPANNLVDDDE